MQSHRWAQGNKDDEKSHGQLASAQHSETAERIPQKKIERLIHSLYSPHPNPCAFWLFGRAQTALQSRSFADSGAFVAVLTNLRYRATLMSLVASSQAGFGDWAGWSKRTESTLLNGETKTLKFRRGVGIQGVPLEHEHFNIGRIKLHSSITFI
jgi:hypothetical protein